MRLVPILFPCDLGVTERGEYGTGGERSAPDLLLDVLEEEGARLARPRMISFPYPDASADPDDPLKLDHYVTQAVRALAEVVESVNGDGDFPLILGGDHLAMCGHVLGHSVRHKEGIGLAVLADAYLDLATPAPPVYDDAKKKSDPEVTQDGNAGHMVLSAALRMIPEQYELGAAMKDSAVQASQTSVLGVRAPRYKQLDVNEKKAGIEVWPLDRLEFDGESAYWASLSRHLAKGPIVLSIDVTGLDPHLMTAVRHPVPDGLDWKFLKRTLEQCVTHVDRILGLDLCQVDPTKDDVHQSAISRLVETIVPFLKRITR